MKNLVVLKTEELSKEQESLKNFSKGLLIIAGFDQNQVWQAIETLVDIAKSQNREIVYTNSQPCIYYDENLTSQKSTSNKKTIRFWGNLRSTEVLSEALTHALDQPVIGVMHVYKVESVINRMDDMDIKKDLYTKTLKGVILTH